MAATVAERTGPSIRLGTDDPRHLPILAFVALVGIWLLQGVIGSNGMPPWASRPQGWPATSQTCNATEASGSRPQSNECRELRAALTGSATLRASVTDDQRTTYIEPEAREGS